MKYTHERKRKEKKTFTSLIVEPSIYLAFTLTVFVFSIWLREKTNYLKHTTNMQLKRSRCHTQFNGDSKYILCYLAVIIFAL